MNQPVEQELSGKLSQHVEAASMVPDDVITAAQKKLDARMLRTTAPVPARSMRPLAYAGALVMMVCVLLLLPLVSDDGRAFAAVRAHFLNFTTLAMQVEQRFNGEILQTSHMLVGADGSVRTDVGDQMSIIVDNTRHQLLTLLHESKQAMQMPLPKLTSAPDSGLGWLKEIRAFQGKATKLKDTRSIEGRPAQGWLLGVGVTQLTLWTDTEGLPLAMEQAAGADLEIRYRFQFNVSVPPGHLSSALPAGYVLVAQAAE